jgi:hypothetical protein
MAITIPVQTEEFEIKGATIKVEYSIDVYQGNVTAPETEVMIYSVNGVPANFFEDAILDKIDEEIRDHNSNVTKKSNSGCGHDEYLSSLMP